MIENNETQPNEGGNGQGSGRERLVGPAIICQVAHRASTDGSAASLEKLAESEPDLANFVTVEALRLVGQLALSGAPTEVVLLVHGAAVSIAVNAVTALQKGHYELWKGMHSDTLLATVDPDAWRPASDTGKQT